MTIVGTRPEIIRLSKIIDVLEQNCNHKLVHTGQNFDFELNEIFFNELQIKKPDFFLGAARSSVAETIGKIIEKTDHRDGFYIYLDLEEVDLNNIFIDTSSDDNSQLKSIKIKLKELNFLKNKYIDQYLDVVFKNETIITMMGKNLNGTIKIDQTNFVKINLNNTRFNIDEINFMQSSSIRDINNINLRFIGTNIRIQDDLVQNIDLYLLRNKNILTIDNIKIEIIKISLV